MNDNIDFNAELKEIASPVIKWLNDKINNPYCEIVITPTEAKLYQHEELTQEITTYEFLHD